MSGVGRPLGLVLLVVLAGCGGFQSERAGTPAETVTPAPVPTVDPTPTPEPDQLAPGLTSVGVTPRELADAHAGRLRTGTFVLHHTRTVVADDSVVRHRVTTGEFVDRYRRYEVVVERNGSAVTASRTVYRYDGRRVTRETTSGNDTTPRVVMDGRDVGVAPADPLEALPFDPEYDGRIARLLRTPETVTVDPQAPRNLFADKIHLVHATDFQQGALGANATNGSVRMLVDPDGLVRSYELRYETVHNGTRVTVVEHLRYSNVVGYSGPEREESR